ncbi:MAG TPA: T9SS type A sorting domain-containing protein [Brumimicrobium sp.]|nr:T9SS type A sorting domain-containing protein [Brumimicrobium sp.]
MKKILLSLIIFPFVAFGQGTVDFEGMTLPTSYDDGSFDEGGVTYSYGHSRDQENFPITGQGLMLRRPSDSYFKWEATNGVGEVSFQYRKAYTGGSIRQLELLVIEGLDTTQATVTGEFGEGSGEQTEIYDFSYAVNVQGVVTIMIKNIGDVEQNRQAVIDNLVWTAFTPTCDDPTGLSVDNISETGADVTWTAGGTETEWLVVYGPTGFDITDYASNADVEEVTVTGTPETTLSDLDAETGYDVYVIAKCDDNEFSDELGPETFTTQTSSIENHLFDNFSFYPNPIQNEVNLKAGSIIENVQVYDMLGKNVIHVSPNSLSTTVNTKELQNGVYIMKVTIKGTQETYRIVKK